MRYLFAAVIAVFVVAVDFESDTKSIWTEPSFTVAQSEPAETSTNAGTATASIEHPQEPDATNVVATPSVNVTEADTAAHAAASVDDETAPANPICDAVKSAAAEND